MLTMYKLCLLRQSVAVTCLTLPTPQKLALQPGTRVLPAVQSHDEIQIPP